MNEYIEEKIKEFEKGFKCIQGDCDGTGHIPEQIAEDEWTSHQCQFHAEYIFPITQKFKQSISEAYNRGVEDSLKCVPDKAIKSSFLDTEHLSNTQYIHASGVIDGRNITRQQTIDNISKLLNNK